MAIKDVIGQEKVANFLVSSIANKKQGHAYLFSGPEATGKRAMAGNFAKAVNCEGKGGDSCDSCISCAKIDKGNHPDIIRISPQGKSIKIEQIRNLIGRINLRPYEGRSKVFIIESADRMTEEASNALLKTLEEPPGSSVIILISSNSSKLLSTIQSRCQIVKFARPHRKFTEGFMIKEHGLDKDAARYLSYMEGGADKKEALLSQGNVMGFKNKVIDGFLSGERDLGLAEETKEKREAVLFVLASFYRDMMALKANTGRKHIMNNDRIDELSRAAGAQSLDALRGTLQDIERTRILIKENINPKLAIANLLQKF